MLTLLPKIATVMGAFAPMFSKRLFAHATLLRVGAILAPGKRTVTAVLHVMGRSHDQHFQNDHRVLHRARCSTLHPGRLLLPLLWCVFAPTGPSGLGIDETLERRW
jgi:hypothetical protein